MHTAQTFARLSRVPAVFLNLLQSVTAAARPTDQGDLTAMGSGFEVRVWQCESNISNGALKTVSSNAIKVVDELADPVVLTTDTIDWSDREVFGLYRSFISGDQHPGQKNDHTFDAWTSVELFWGYIGLGAQKSGGGAVSSGNPPYPASVDAGYGGSWAVRVATDVWLYLDAADGSLKLYNDSGSTLYKPTLILFATAQTGKRS